MSVNNDVSWFSAPAVMRRTGWELLLLGLAFLCLFGRPCSASAAEEPRLMALGFGHTCASTTLTSDQGRRSIGAKVRNGAGSTISP